MIDQEKMADIIEVLQEFPKWIQIYRVLLGQCRARYGYDEGRLEAIKTLKFIIEQSKQEAA